MWSSIGQSNRRPLPDEIRVGLVPRLHPGMGLGTRLTCGACAEGYFLSGKFIYRWIFAITELAVDRQCVFWMQHFHLSPKAHMCPKVRFICVWGINAWVTVWFLSHKLFSDRSLVVRKPLHKRRNHLYLPHAKNLENEGMRLFIKV